MWHDSLMNYELKTTSYLLSQGCVDYKLIALNCDRSMLPFGLLSTLNRALGTKVQLNTPFSADFLMSLLDQMYTL